MLDIQNSPFPSPGDPEAPERHLLLLARQGDAWGLAAARAATESGFEVEQCADAAETLARLDAPAHGEPEVEAVLLVARALTTSRPADVRELSRRTSNAGVPVVVLAEPGVPPSGPLAHLEHVTVVETPPSERVLSAVLTGACRERDTRRRLRELADQLEAAGRREQDLLARVGHELRNPLSAITSALTLIEETEASDEAGPSDTRYREVIGRQIETLRRAVDGLLTVGEQAPASAGNDNREAAIAGRRPAGAAAPPVLLVEDDADGRQALGELLDLWGYRVAVAADGERGLELAGQRVPKVALVDIGLPGIDGYEVARRLRARYPGDEMPLLVAMTGFGQPEDRRRALAAGFDVHLVKPVLPGKLSALLAEACDGDAN